MQLLGVVTIYASWHSGASRMAIKSRSKEARRINDSFKSLDYSSQRIFHAGRTNLIGMAVQFRNEVFGAKSAAKWGGMRMGRPVDRSTHTATVFTRARHAPSATRVRR